VLLEGSGQLIKSSDLVGIRTRDLPVCSIVPQPTTLPRAPNYFGAQNMMESFTLQICKLLMNIL
jgi:hypothetical protein